MGEIVGEIVGEMEADAVWVGQKVTNVWVTVDVTVGDAERESD